MMNENLEATILKRLEDVLEKAHADYIKAQDPLPSERDTHFKELQDLYEDIENNLIIKYSIEYVQKLKEEIEEFKEKVRELCN